MVTKKKSRVMAIVMETAVEWCKDGVLLSSCASRGSGGGVVLQDEQARELGAVVQEFPDRERQE